MLGVGLGGLVAARLIPAHLQWLYTTATFVLSVGIAVLVFARLSSRGVRTRLWGGPRWVLPVVLAGLAAASVVVVGFVDEMSTALTAVWAVAVAVVYTLAGIVSQVAYRRHMAVQE